MIKQYKKTYEDVFTSERLDKKCTLEKLDFNGEMTSGEYIKIFSDLIDEYQIILFDKWIKLYWLVINFSYNGTVSKNLMPTNASHDAAFTVFCRNYINFNRRFLSHGMYFNKITQYFPELFPNFSSENPFKIPYEYPFEYMTFDCMILVYQLPERIELLNFGDEKKMTYPQFMDYVINYSLCSNEEIGNDDYLPQLPKNTFPPYIKYEHYAGNKRLTKKPKRKPRKRT